MKWIIMAIHEDACEIMSDSSIYMQIQEYITEVYPEFDNLEILQNKMPVIERSDCICKELNDYYCERERYDLHWVFKQASQSVIVRQQKLSEKLREEIPNYQEIVASTSNSTKLRVKRMKNIFNLLSFLVSFIDIAVSVGLILLVTFLSQKIESQIESLILNIVVIGFIALAKVSLDRFLIIPAVERWGWRRYLKAIELMKRISIRLISMGIILEEAVKANEDNEKLIELFLRNFDEKRVPHRRDRKRLDDLLKNYQESSSL